MTVQRVKALSDDTGLLIASGIGGIVDALSGSVRPTTYENLQWLVRNSMTSKVFKVGDKLTVNRTSGSHILDVLGIDHDGTPSLTLGLHDCATSMQYSASQMIWGNTSANALPAGTYYITLLNGAYNDGTAEDGDYQITISQPVPVGGGIRHSTMGQSREYGKAYVTAGKWTTYGADRVAIETGLACTEGNAGSCLGTATCSNPAKLVSSLGTMNYTQRNCYGSGEYAKSAVRLWMNSGAASNYWTPQGSHDLPPTNKAAAGFKYDIDPDFLAILGSVEKKTQQGRPDGSTLATTDEVFFLPSFTEVYAGSLIGGAEGSAYDWYKDFSDSPAAAHTAADSNRIKRVGGNAGYWWTRSAFPSYASYACLVSPSGAMYYFASSANGVAPACTIC